MAEIVWPGKYVDGERVTAPRTSTSARRRWSFGDDDGGCRLWLGDNLAALDALCRDFAGKVDLVYIDPPFATGGKFSVSTRVGLGRDGRPPPEIDAPAYSDRFEGGVDGFLAMLDARLQRIHELLAPHGSFYLHVDPTVGHAVKLLCDEVFGAASFQREIVWRIGWVSGFKTKAKNWIRNHDLIYFYTKDPQKFTFNKHYVPYPEGYTRRDGSPPKGVGMPIDDVWNANETEFSLRGRESLDSIQIKSFSNEKSGYATQKNESLLRRIIEASSNEGDLVLDAFCGSGTTGVAATGLGRRFIGCDVNPAAIHIATKRLLQAEVPGVRVETVSDSDRRTDSDSDSDSDSVSVSVSVSDPEVRAIARPDRSTDSDSISDSDSLSVSVSLSGVEDRDPSSWPEALKRLEPSNLDLVDAWWVGRPDPDGGETILAWSSRTHQQRELQTTLTVPKRSGLRITVVDVLYRVTVLEL